MNQIHGIFCAALALLAAADVSAQQPAAPSAASGTNSGVRTIRLRQDDAQVRFESRIYELQHAVPEDVLPFVNSAILRYSRNSTIRRVTSKDPKAKGALLVSTGRDFLPYVDSIVAALDRPGRVDDSGSVIQGTGLCRIAYAPKYRAASEFSQIIDSAINSSVGKAYVNPETNTIFWRDQTESAEKTLAWVERLDRPIPQISVRLNYYELRDSDLKDWGFDYLAWKNGPGVNLLNVGYNAGHMTVDELLNTVPYAGTMSWAYGGFFTAPQIDMSFIRCLQQSGNANAAASASLTMVNTPVRSMEEYFQIVRTQFSDISKAPYVYSITMYPEYQNIAKNTLGRTFLGKSYYEDEDGNKYPDPPALDAKIINPFVCLPGASGTAPGMEKLPDGGVIFIYSLYFKNVIERGNTGAELSNSVQFSGAATLGFGVEKVLSIYEKENDVEQTIGLPILCRIPYVKYLFSTVTSIRERTYIVVTAEAHMADAGSGTRITPASETGKIKRRIEDPFRKAQEE